MNQTFAAIKVTWTRKGKHSRDADCVLILAHRTPQINALDHLNIVQIFLSVLAHLRSHRQSPQKIEFVPCHAHICCTIKPIQIKTCQPAFQDPRRTARFRRFGRNHPVHPDIGMSSYRLPDGNKFEKYLAFSTPLRIGSDQTTDFWGGYNMHLQKRPFLLIRTFLKKSG